MVSFQTVMEEIKQLAPKIYKFEHEWKSKTAFWNLFLKMGEARIVKIN